MMALILLGALIPANRVGAQTPAAIAINAKTPPVIVEGLMSGLKNGGVDGVTFRDPAGMRDYYANSGYTLLWLKDATQFTDDAKTVLSILDLSWTHGLNPMNYNVEKIRSLIDTKGVVNRYDLELLLSDAVIRYGRDLTGMRVKPASVGQLDRYWQPPMRGADILAWMAKNKGDATDALARLAPQGELYKKLREELVRELVNPEEKGRPAVRLNGYLRPGTHNDAVPVIRAYLGETIIPPEGPTYYDNRLLKKIMAFQEDHGFAPDGIIGPSTQKILNLSRMDKITQLVANLERQRWMDRVKPDKYVMVNIPSATLWAVEKGHSPLQMRVVVGKETRPTNSFKTTITGVRFNPTWTVPPTIKKEDYLPKLAQDPEYLAKRGIEVIYQGKTVDPTTIDWANLPWEQASALNMVQNNGATNPLGRVRVLMPNPYNIYLHDTNDRSVFTRNSRTLSSGCIRIERPEELANFILRDNEGWSTGAMQGLFDAGKMRDIATAKQIPVYLVYNTIWEKDDGKLIYGYDLYALDDQLMGVIRSINGFKPPDNIGEIASAAGFRAKTGLDYRAPSR